MRAALSSQYLLRGIIFAKASRRSLGSGGSNHYYTIDARGADLGASNRIARAIEAAHSSAIAGGVRASADRTTRTPQRSKS